MPAEKCKKVKENENKKKLFTSESGIFWPRTILEAGQPHSTPPRRSAEKIKNCNYYYHY